MLIFSLTYKTLANIIFTQKHLYFNGAYHITLTALCDISNRQVELNSWIIFH